MRVFEQDCHENGFENGSPSSSRRWTNGSRKPATSEFLKDQVFAQEVHCAGSKSGELLLRAQSWTPVHQAYKQHKN